MANPFKPHDRSKPGTRLPPKPQPKPADGVSGTRKCLYCERDMLVGSECLSKAQSESCGMRDGVAIPPGEKR